MSRLRRLRLWAETDCCDEVDKAHLLILSGILQGLDCGLRCGGGQPVPMPAIRGRLGARRYPTGAPGRTERQPVGQAAT
jgi:hypothetical protein